MYEQLSEITIVILTRNRHSKLKKVIDYWSKIPVKLLIVDETKVDLIISSKFTEIKYINLRQPIRERMIFAANQIDTPYAILISDDELLIPSALITMLKELKNDSSLSCVGGVTLAVWKYGFRTCGLWAYQKTFSWNIREEDIISRFKNIANYSNDVPRVSFMWYNLFKTEVFKSILRVTGSLNIQGSEATSLLIAPAAGQIMYIPEIYSIRNWNFKPLSTPQVDRHFNIAHYFKFAVNDMNLEKLKTEFQKWGDKSQFYFAFGVVMKIMWDSSDKLVSQNFHSNLIYTIQNYKVMITLKYLFKSIFLRKLLPPKFITELSRMSNSGVKFHYGEVKNAIKFVNQCK